MARTTAAAVQGVLVNDYDPNTPSLTPFIDAASVLVERCVARAAERSMTVSSSDWEILERWLAAHAYCCNDPTYLERQTQSARGRYMGTSGLGLNGTRYGQMALTLDPTGTLAKLGKTVQIEWLGLPESEQLDYDERD